MDTDKKTKILQITDGKSNRLRESYMYNNYYDIYTEIINFTSHLNLPFIQRLWHWVNNHQNYYLCKCGSRTNFNRNWLDGYKLSCSAKCAQDNNLTKEKRKKTIIEKYGVDNIAKLDSIKEKQAQTNIEKWGSKSSFQNSEVRAKYKNSIQEKFGVDHYFKTEEFKLKSKSYYLKKWGVDHQLKVDEIKEKIKSTCLDRYGVETYLNTDHSRSCIKFSNRSSFEDEICEWLKSSGFRYTQNSYDLIKPYSIDIFIEDFKLAIEFNGLYWHSEFFKEKDYHQKKSLLCRNLGIHLIHIWEDDWLSRKEVIKSIILNKLKSNIQKIFARKCILKKVDNKEASAFLNQNHLQGYVRFSHAFGLYHNHQLVSLMAFGWRATNGKKEYELIRFCNQLNVNVVGAASKIFKHFVSLNDIKQMTSYSDLSIFEGGLYKSLGFTNIGTTIINYWWVVGGVRKHRFNYNKRKLVNLGYDRSKTEVEIMHENNHWRVFGCGQEKWIWTA